MPVKSLDRLTSIESFQVTAFEEFQSAEFYRSLSLAEALLVRTDPPLNASFLSRAPNLKVICRAGIGVDHIDLKFCAQKNIKVMNTPAANRIATAEMAFALILSLARKIPDASLSMASGKWEREKFVGVELQKKTLGIIGLGNIGSLLAKRAQIFDMHVVACDPYLPDERFEELQVEKLTLSQCASVCDFLSIHVPLTAENRNMISTDVLKQMKPSSFLINTSRGPVVNELALAKALKEGLIAGAALDVFAEEPLAHPNAFTGLTNVLLTPHEAGQTKESIARMSLDAVIQLKRFFLYGILENSVLQ